MPGAGYRLEVRPEDVRAAEPPAPAPAAALRLVRSTLPRARALLGREATLESLRLLVERPGIVSVVGPLGVGKSALAIETLRALTQQTSRGAWFVDTSELDDGTALLGAIASTLGLDAGSEAALSAALAQRDDVLLLDGVDGVLAAARKLALSLRSACPHLTLVVTAHRPLRVGEEQLFRLDGLDATAAAELFLQRSAGDRVPGYDDPGAVEEALGPLSGLPLAIELAAPWVGFLRPRELGQALARKLDLLRSDRPDLPERHRNLQAALERTWESLTDAGREALSAAAVFRAPFPASDLDLLATEDGAEVTLPSRLLLEVRGLDDRSLVRRFPDGLLQLWGPVGTFVRRKLPQPQAEDALTAVMARHGHPTALRKLDELSSAASLLLVKARAVDFERAAQRALQAGDGLGAVRCVRVLLRATPHAFPSSAWCDLAERALALPPADETEQLDLVGEAHGALHATGRRDEALDRLRRAARRAEELGDPALLSRILRPEAALTRDLDPAASLELAELAVEAAERSGDTGWLGRALCTRAISQREVGEIDGARRTLERGLKLLRDRDDNYLVGPLVSLASLELAKERPQRALALLQEARRHSADRQHPLTSISLMLGRTLSQLGQVSAAREHFDAAVRHARELGRQVEEAQALTGQGEALRRWGDPAAALVQLRRASHLHAAHDHRAGQALATVRMGLASLDLGDVRSAARYLERAKDAAEDLETPQLLGQVAALEAELSVERGDLERARGCFAAGADMLEVAGAREDLVPLFERWAEMEAGAGEGERAEALFERLEAAALLTTVDAPAPVVDEVELRRRRR